MQQTQHTNIQTKNLVYQILMLTHSFYTALEIILSLQAQQIFEESFQTLKIPKPRTLYMNKMTHYNHHYVWLRQMC